MHGHVDDLFGASQILFGIDLNNVELVSGSSVASLQCESLIPTPTRLNTSHIQRLTPHQPRLSPSTYANL